MVSEIVETVKTRKREGTLKRSAAPLRLLSAIIYRHSKKFNTEARLFWVKDTCNGCGSCKKVCPVKNVEMDNGKPKRGDACEQCLACIHWCPKEAIEFGKNTKNRKRYRNLQVKMADIIASAKE